MMGSDLAHRPLPVHAPPESVVLSRQKCYVGRGQNRVTRGAQRKRPLGTPRPFFPLLKRPPPRHTQQGRRSREVASFLPAAPAGRGREGRAAGRRAGEHTLLIWSWVFLILWSSGVSATTLKPLPLFFSNSSL